MRKLLGFALALWLGLAAASAWGAIGSCVDLGHNQSTAVTSPLTMTTTAAISAGDTVCFLHYGAATANTMSSPLTDGTNTYTRFYSDNGTAPVAEMACSVNSAAVSTGATISMPFNGASGNRHAISAFKVSGIALLDAFDVHGTANSASSASFSVTKPLQATPVELVILGYFSATTPTTVTWPSGFTGVGGNTATAFAMPACGTVSAVDSVVYTPSWTGTNNVRLSVGTLKGAVAAAPGRLGTLKVGQ